MVSRNHFTQYLLPLSLALIVMLSGCRGMAISFSPEAAARQAVLDRPTPDMNVDPGSIQVLQTADLNGKKVVMIAFKGNNLSMGHQSCVFTYEVMRSNLTGWQVGGGGGGCSGDQNAPDQQPISIGSGKSGGGPTDIGYSEVDGQVFDESVTVVQITWSDGQVQQVNVINHSYLAVRTGTFDLAKVEALDADQKVVFSNEMSPAPGK